MCGVCLTHPVLFVGGIFSDSYTPCAILCGECALQSVRCFMWVVCLTHPVLLPYAGNLSYTPLAILCGNIV